MKKKNSVITKKGDFELLGIKRVDEGSVTITFECGRDSQAFIRLYETGSDKYTDIPVPVEYSTGMVRSVTICDLDMSTYDYNLVIDGTEMLFPFATCIKGREKWADPDRSDEEALRGRFVFPDFGELNDTCPMHAPESLILYKLNVRGFTKNDKTVKSKKGTFKALEEKIPYLKDLGINAVELMPIYEFNELFPTTAGKKDLESWNPQAKKGYEMLEHKAQQRINYWGYGPGDYHAPKASFSHSSEPVSELVHLIYSLHSAGIECIMEMCFPEGITTNYITEILKFWVINYHIDGFHLLVPGINARDIAAVPLLRYTRIFYDNIFSTDDNDLVPCRNLYQYRDDFMYITRKQVNVIENNIIDTLRIMRRQSNDICYVNYIANNNGFTLRDLFSYALKHNEANGEKNTDGNDYNYSTNCGAEGPTRKLNIKKKRIDMMKLALTVTFISQGCPLIYMGDELGNTQNGNNNTYCQDNKLGYLSWDELPRFEEFHGFVKELIAFRSTHPIIFRDRPIDMSVTDKNGFPLLSYHTKDAWTNGLSPILQTVGILFCDEKSSCPPLYAAINFSSGLSELSIPSLPKGKAFKFVFGTCDYTGEKVTSTINIPPHTVWFFEGRGRS